MKKLLLLTTIVLLTLFSCTKEEGEGGRSSITGKIHITDKTGGNQGDYYAPDYDVYIIYGEDDDIYDDDTKTNYDGSFEFKNLRKGSYRIFAYTIDLNQTSGVAPVFKSADLGGNEKFDIGNIEVEK